MAHHQADPNRLELLTPGVDIGGGRIWKYTQNPEEDPFLATAGFWVSTTPLRPPTAMVWVVGEGQFTGVLWAFTRDGMKRSPLDILIKELGGASADIPMEGPFWDGRVRDSMCRMMGCGG